MSLRQRFHVAIIAAGLVAANLAGAQSLRPDASDHAPRRPSLVAQAETPQSEAADMPPEMNQTPGHRSAAAQSKPLPGIPATPAAAIPAKRTSAHSLLDDPAVPARIQVSGEQLSISATNASLSEVIRQVATQTGMQVEGNSRDERVFGTYGPGSPPDVLSALLYDSGYNVIMVGSTADGAPRRLVLSTRTAAAAAQGAVQPARNGDEDEEEPPVEVPQPQPNAVIQAAPAAPPSPGQPRTPQQMLEELQRMHQGQQPQELPHE